MIATPQVFIFDADRKLRYTGRFDDGEVKPVKSHDAKNAVDALLAGTEVAVKTTRVPGCSTKWAEKEADARKSLERWNAEPVSLEPIDLAGVAKLAKNDTKKLLLVNLWATWCGPCVAELPELVTMNRMYRGRNFELVTISLDDLAKKDDALRVLKENHVAASNFDPERRRPRQVRRGPRPGMARPGSLHAPGRARRQDPLPQNRRDRPARSQASHRGLPRPHVLNRRIVGWVKPTITSRRPGRPTDRQ